MNESVTLTLKINGNRIELLMVNWEQLPKACTCSLNTFFIIYFCLFRYENARTTPMC